MKRLPVFAFLAALVWLVATSAAAGEPVCPAGNLLAGRTPVHASGIRDADRITDGFAGVEGAPWNDHESALFTTAAAQVVYDLGQTARIAVLRVQASGDDAYAVSASLDGTSWTAVWTAQPVGGTGLRLREARDLDVAARYLRLSASAGNGDFSAAELQAWCRDPEPWSLKVVMDPSVYEEERERRLERAAGPLAMGILAFAVFAFLLAREQRQMTSLTRWGSIAGASGMVVLAAVGVHGVIGGVAAAAAAAVLAGCLRCLGAETVESGRAQLIGVLAGAAAAVYLAAHLGTTRSVPAAWLWGAYSTATVALRYGDRPWADWIPPLAGTAALSFAVGMTWGALFGIGVACGGGVAAALVRSQRAGGTTVRWLDWLALLPLVAASPLVWTHFGQFHGNGQLIQAHDTFHYYMGSKYIREIGYTNLYHCAAVAEWEEGYARELELRRIRDLRTNRLVPSRSMTSRPDVCHEAFSAERWAAFRQDLRMFRALLGPRAWGDVFRDHGYNASPVWSLIGHLLSNADWRRWIRDIPAAASTDSGARRHPDLAMSRSAFLRDLNAFRRLLTSLALIDPLLYAGAFSLLGWAFGLRAMALATVVWAVGYPWSYAWIGGAFGRMYWLFSAVAAVCLLKKERHLLAGVGLSFSFLFRVFPALLFTGVGLNLLRGLAGRRGVSRHHLQLITGAIGAIAVLLPVSVWIFPGQHVFKGFLDNSLKHQRTPSTNLMGLPTVFAWDPEKTMEKTKDNALDEPLAEWKVGRSEARKRRAPFYWITAFALMGLLGLAVKNSEDWVATVMSVGVLVAFCELSSYYYNVAILLAPVALCRLRCGLALIATVGLSQLLPLEIFWYDQLYSAQALLFLALILFLLADRAISIRTTTPRGPAWRTPTPTASSAQNATPAEEERHKD